MKVPNRFRACFCMEPNYGQQQDQWLLQERLRQIRRLEEEVARLKWRNYNLDAQLTQTFDILDSQADITRTFSGVIPTAPPPSRFAPVSRQGTSRDMLDELRNRPSYSRQSSGPSPRMSRRENQGSLTARGPTDRPTSLDLPLKQDFRVPNAEAISRAGSKGSLPPVKREMFTFDQGKPRARSDDVSDRDVLKGLSIPKLNNATTDKADLTHH